MSAIIVGRFQLQHETEYAVNELVHAGYSRAAITTFYLNPAGQHDQYPVGGDRDKSPGADDTGVGVAAGASTGAVVGATVGAATLPVTGVAGPALGGLVGAHVGSLLGSLGATDDSDQEPRRQQPEDSSAEVRKAGMRVAVQVQGRQENEAIALLHSLNAADIERSEGHIVEGDWDDFDPLSTPRYVDLQSNSSYTGRF